MTFGGSPPVRNKILKGIELQTLDLRHPNNGVWANSQTFSASHKSRVSPPMDKSKTGGSSELKRSSRKLPTCSLHLSFYLVFFFSLSQESKRCFLVTGPAQTEVWSDLFQNSKTGTWYVMQCTTHGRKSDADKDMLWGFCKHSSCNKTTKSAKNIKSCLPLHGHHVSCCPTVCFVLQLHMNIDL